MLLGKATPCATVYGAGCDADISIEVFSSLWHGIAGAHQHRRREWKRGKDAEANNRLRLVGNAKWNKTDLCLLPCPVKCDWRSVIDDDNLLLFLILFVFCVSSFVGISLSVPWLCFILFRRIRRSNFSFAGEKALNFAKDNTPFETVEKKIFTMRTSRTMFFFCAAYVR